MEKLLYVVREDTPVGTAYSIMVYPLYVRAMSEQDDRQLADDAPPQRAPCQQCSELFDWNQDACPHCGWEKDEWVASNRYELQ